MATKVEYEKFAVSFFESPTGCRYASPEAIKAVTEQMAANRALPSLVSAEIAFKSLGLPRVDGGSDASDAKQAVADAQKNLDQAIREADAPPLTKDELDYFASLSQRDLSDLYWGEDGDGISTFSTRYNKAAREFMYQIPLKFSKRGE